MGGETAETVQAGRPTGDAIMCCQDKSCQTHTPEYVFCVMSHPRVGMLAYRRVGVRASLRMDERDWRIPIEPRSKSKVTSLPLPHADTPTRGLGHDAKHVHPEGVGLLKVKHTQSGNSPRHKKFTAVSVSFLRGSSTYCALNCLWRLSECPNKRTPHSLAISETVLSGNFLGGEATSLHHQPRRFHAQPFDGLRG
jgi:hypothetical protein